MVLTRNMVTRTMLKGMKIRFPSAAHREEVGKRNGAADPLIREAERGTRGRGGKRAGGAERASFVATDGGQTMLTLRSGAPLRWIDDSIHSIDSFIRPVPSAPRATRRRWIRGLVDR